MNSIRIQLNGEPHGADSGITVARLIEQLKLKPGRIAVEINRAVVPKMSFEHTIINDGDVVEIINFVGGG
jgi:thiamine biosynthesis protein ThiS